MNESRLKELLRRADDPPATGTDPADLAGAVLRRRDRQTRVRRTGVVALVVITAAAGLWQLARPATNQDQPMASVPAVASDRAEADRLGREAEAWLAIARRAEAVERLNRAEAAAARLHAVVQSERERAATVMLRQGEWRQSQGQSGAEEYRRAAELFDGTRAAAEARARLGQG